MYISGLSSVPDGDTRYGEKQSRKARTELGTAGRSGLAGMLVKITFE